MSAWDERRRAAVHREALATATDPTTDERTRRHARRELARPAIDWKRLDDDQLTVFVDLNSMLHGQPLEADYYAAAERAAAAQRLADLWREQAAAIPTATRTPIEGCSRCKEFSDEDLRCLREAIAEDKIVEAEPVAALPDGGNDGDE